MGPRQGRSQGHVLTFSINCTCCSLETIRYIGKRFSPNYNLRFVVTGHFFYDAVRCHSNFTWICLPSNVYKLDVWYDI